MCLLLTAVWNLFLTIAKLRFGIIYSLRQFPIRLQ